MYSKIWDYLIRLIIITFAAVSTYSTNFSIRVLMLFVAFVLFEFHDEFAKKRDKDTKPIDKL